MDKPRICPNCNAPIYGKIEYCVCGTKLSPPIFSSEVVDFIRDMIDKKGDKCSSK